MTRLDGKVAFVTGGASGLGEAAARRFAAEGARVVIADIDQATAERVAKELDDAIALHVDTSSSASVAQGVADAVDRYGRIDVIFNNAGITSKQQPLHEMDDDNWRRVMAVNADGVFFVLKHGIAAMLKTGGGSIINMSSTAGIAAQKDISPYTFAKAGVIGLTQSAAIEYATQGIRVNAVAPTAVMTPLVREHIEGAADPEAMRVLLETFNPMPGMPGPEDVVSVVVFLASDEARWVTGHTIPIDGGYCAQ